MPQYGSSQNLISTNLSQTVDNQGNPIISSDTGFGSSPLGYAARAQALFGLPNSTFDLTPPDTTAVISQANPLPYWDVQDYSSGVMSGSAIYDSATNSWGVNLNPGTAAANDYITMTTRSYLINDDNLSLRQQAFAVVSKVGTYAGTTQWNLELTASYYDSTNTLLHSGTVATIYDNTTWTSMAGTTTTGGSAINSAAHYVDIQFKLTATAAVTSATSVTIKSTILQTSSGAGAKSFLVTDTFTSSGTWTRPTGVDYLVAVVGISGGGGGGGGGLSSALFDSIALRSGGGGGGAGRWAIIRDVNVAGIATVSVGIGAGGSGGTAAATLIKGAGSANSQDSAGGNGSAGGTTTFGTYLTVPGGNGGGGGAGASTGDGGTAGTTATTPLYPGTPFGQLAGGNGLGGGSIGGTAAAGGVNTYSSVPYTVASTAVGTAGGSASLTGGTGSITITSPGLGGTAGAVGYNGGGGGGSPATTSSGTAHRGGGGGGGGGGAGATLRVSGTSVRWSGTAGAGGGAALNSGSGGGGAGGVSITGGTGTGAGGSAQYRDSAGTIVSAAGGPGAAGAVFVVYIG